MPKRRRVQLGGFPTNRLQKVSAIRIIKNKQGKVTKVQALVLDKDMTPEMRRQLHLAPQKKAKAKKRKNRKRPKSKAKVRTAKKKNSSKRKLKIGSRAWVKKMARARARARRAA